MSADFCFPLPHLLALPTEAWRGVEICRRSAENGYVNLPEPVCKQILFTKDIKNAKLAQGVWVEASINSTTSERLD
jgi:hypothetical protein